MPLNQFPTALPCQFPEHALDSIPLDGEAEPLAYHDADPRIGESRRVREHSEKRRLAPTSEFFHPVNVCALSEKEETRCGEASHLGDSSGRTISRQPNGRVLLPAAEPGPSDRFSCSCAFETRDLVFASGSKVV